MKKKFKIYGLWIAILLLVAAFMTACSPQQEPEQPPEVPIPDCSVAVSVGMGMYTVFQKLGVQDYPNADPILLVNGAEETKRYDLQINDFVVLATKPEVCSGTYTNARQVHFNFKSGEWREISGFQAPVTESRVRNALEQVCEGVRWWNFGLRFNGDLQNGGCNYVTAIKISLQNGTTICSQYATMYEAYESNLTNLNDIRWMSFYSNGEQSTSIDYCAEQ